MTQVKVRAIDGDGHVRETGPVGNVHEYLEEPYRKFAEGASGLLPGLVPTDGWFRLLGGRLMPGPGNFVEDWLAKLDQAGMDMTVLYPTIGLFAGFIRDPDYQVAFTRARNSWVVETMCHPGGGRLQAVGLLPPLEPGEAAKELRRMQALGLVGAMLPADGGHLLGNRAFHQIYTAAAETGLPLAVHAAGSHLNSPELADFPKFVQTHTLAHPFGIMRQFTSMMFDGTFELFPNVRFAFLEAGVTWVPWMLNRMDEEYEHRGDVEAPVLKRKPSEYVARGTSIFFSCEAGESMLRPVLDRLPPDIVMYASDYPHWDSEFPASLHHLEEREDLTEDQRAGVLHRASERFYGFAATDC